MVLSEVVSNEGLAAIFIDSLKDFVSSRITEAREERGKLATSSSTRIISEDDTIECGY